MKKLLLSLLAASLLVFTLAGCSNNAASNSKTGSSTSQASESNNGSAPQHASRSYNPDDPDDAIRTMIDKEFQELFGYDKFADGINDNKRIKQSFEELGLSIEDYCRAAAGLYSYEIKNIKIDGDQAEVELQFRGPELGEAFEERVGNKIKELAGVDDLEKISKEEALKLETKAIYDILKSDDLPTPTRDIKQFYVKSQDGGWAIDKNHEGCEPFADFMN